VIDSLVGASATQRSYAAMVARSNPLAVNEILGAPISPSGSLGSSVFAMWKRPRTPATRSP
jgi:hypothetical protein